MNLNRFAIRDICHRVAATATALLVVGAGLALSAAPASAVTSSQYGSGWLTRSAAGSVTSWSSTGGKPAITGHSMGVYSVTFPGITGGFGVPTVTAGNQFPAGWCAIDNYGVKASGVVVTFSCHERSGAAVESDFTVSYTSFTGANEGWVDADQPTVNGTYVPARSYDAAGGTTTVSHNPTYPGVYKMTFPGVVMYPSLGSMIVTSMAPGDHCSVGSANWDDHTDVAVYCFDRTGMPADTRFVVHIVGARTLLGSAPAKAGWATTVAFPLGTSKPARNLRFTSNGNAVTVKHAKHGTYEFTFKGLGGAAARGAQASVIAGPGDTDARCGAVASTVGTDAVVAVKCFDAIGKPSDRIVTVNVFGS